MCLEQIINKKLVHIIKERKLLPSQQYGYRKNRYTIYVLIILENNIADAFRQGQSTAIISLDFWKACDMCGTIFRKN
jgi:hypothetical protein